jgi:sugar lactone lactonase YvrE
MSPRIVVGRLSGLMAMRMLWVVLAATVAAAAERAVHVLTISHLEAPVAAIHDADEDVYFVSNINGQGTARDNNGYISRMSPDGRITSLKFIEGGHSGVTLNAPKGLAIVGDDLWVADIDCVRAFSRTSGRLVRTVQMPSPGGLFLNEMTVGPDRAVYVTDTRLEFNGENARHLGPDRVFRISADGEATLALEADLEAPSGIAWDAPRERFLITALQGTHVFEWRPGNAPSAIWKGIGGYDGIVLDGPSWIVSSLDDGGLYEIRDGVEQRIIEKLITPAAIGFDRRRRRLLIPSFEANTLQLWDIRAR